MNRILKTNNIYLLVAVIFAIKLLLLPFAQTTHSDAVSRIFTSITWVENPIWITKSIWAPFQFYINGIALMIWDNVIYTPKIVNIIFSCLTLIPFYFFTKREFNKNGAFVATLFLAVSPILFRYSFMALSETPYLFFLVFGLNLLSKGVRNKALLFVILAGISFNIAGGIRYEAWLVTTCVCLVLLLKKQWKYLFVFSLVSSVFPVYWLYISYIETGDFLYGFNGTYDWNIGIMGNNNNLNFESYLRRVWFYPFSWIIAVGIPVGHIILRQIINSNKEKNHLPYSLPFGIMLVVFIFFSLRGTLLLQHHYIGTLVILSLPFCATYFNDIDKRLKALLFACLTVLLSFIYNTDGISPLPRLENQYPTEIVEEIKPENNHGSLVIDFIGWQETFFITLNGGYKATDMIVSVDGENAQIDFENVKAKLNNYPSGYLILKNNSELHNFVIPIIEKQNLEVISNREEVTLYKWSK